MFPDDPLLPQYVEVEDLEYERLHRKRKKAEDSESDVEEGRSRAAAVAAAAAADAAAHSNSTSPRSSASSTAPVSDLEVLLGAVHGWNHTGGGHANIIAPLGLLLGLTMLGLDTCGMITGQRQDWAVLPPWYDRCSLYQYEGTIPDVGTLVFLIAVVIAGLQVSGVAPRAVLLTALAGAACLVTITLVANSHMAAGISTDWGSPMDQGASAVRLRTDRSQALALMVTFLVILLGILSRSRADRNTSIREVYNIELFTSLAHRMRAQKEQAHAETLRNAASHARQAAKREVTERLLGYAAHELRNPLFVLESTVMEMVEALGQLHSVEADRLTLESVQNDARVLQRSVEQMRRVTNDVLDHQKLSSGRLRMNIRPCEVVPALRGIVSEWRCHDIPDRVPIVLSTRLPAAAVRLDANRLAQIIANGLSNASKHCDVARAGGGALHRLWVVARTSADGQLSGDSRLATGSRASSCQVGPSLLALSPDALPSVDASEKALPRPPSGSLAVARDRSLPSRKGRNLLIVSVYNLSRRGLNGRDPESLFKPFEQGDGDSTTLARGTGLGLPIARLLARAMHGTVYIQDLTASDVEEAASLVPTLTPHGRKGIDRRHSSMTRLLEATMAPNSARNSAIADECAQSMRTALAKGWSVTVYTCMMPIEPVGLGRPASGPMPGSFHQGVGMALHHEDSNEHSSGDEDAASLHSGDGIADAVAAAGRAMGSPTTPPVTLRHGRKQPRRLPHGQRKLRCVICDDEELNRMVYRRMLNRWKDVEIVAELEDGEDLVDLLLPRRSSNTSQQRATPPEQEVPPPLPDFVLLDMQMRRMNGDEAARRLRRAGITVPLIACTGDYSACDLAYADEGESPVSSNQSSRRVIQLHSKHLDSHGANHSSASGSLEVGVVLKPKPKASSGGSDGSGSPRRGSNSSRHSRRRPLFEAVLVKPIHPSTLRQATLQVVQLHGRTPSVNRMSAIASLPLQ